jgi:ketosteroid isomerase-like protein
MSDEAENRATIETFWRAWNEERLDDAMTMYAVDARLRHFTHGIDVTGAELIRELMEMSRTAFPGRRSDVNGIYAAADHVITENRFHGKLADSGQELTNDICYIFQFVDGKVAEQREYG